MPIKTLSLYLLCALLIGSSAGAAPTQSDPPAARPALSGHTSRGEALDLAQWRGQVVLVYLWSTDCPVCLDRLPELRRNLAGWSGQPFVIVAVNQDARLADFKAYEQALDAVLPPQPQMKLVWRRDPAHRDNLGDTPVRQPTTLLLNRDGALVKEVRGSWPAGTWDDIAELVLN
ncbi:TlpA disulfide reductase family protein [Ideonella sp.]|uniref:TlpA disulfide reductase family protein n=1 Tax=Ideonella sp. TaxID=1929293 RepID=UPI0035B4699F